MTQPVVEDGYDYLSYFGLTVGTVAGVALVAGVRSMGRVLLGKVPGVSTRKQAD